MAQQSSSSAPVTETQPNLSGEVAQPAKRSRSWYEPISTWFKNRRSPPPAPSTNLLDAIAQETCARLKRCDDAAAIENPCGHMRAVASAVVREWRESGVIAQDQETPWDEERPSGPLESRPNASEQTQAIVDRLPDNQRKVLLMRVNEGLTYQQIAERLSVSHRVVLRDLSRAYSKIRMADVCTH